MLEFDLSAYTKLKVIPLPSKDASHWQSFHHVNSKPIDVFSTTRDRRGLVPQRRGRRNIDYEYLKQSQHRMSPMKLLHGTPLSLDDPLITLISYLPDMRRLLFHGHIGSNLKNKSEARTAIYPYLPVSAAQIVA